MTVVKEAESRSGFDLGLESAAIVQPFGIGGRQGREGWPEVFRLSGLAALAELDRDIRAFKKVVRHPSRMRTKSALRTYTVLVSVLLNMSDEGQLSNDLTHSYDVRLRDRFTRRAALKGRIGGEITHTVLIPQLNGGFIELMVELCCDAEGGISFDFFVDTDAAGSSVSGWNDESIKMISFLENLCRVVWAAQQGKMLE